MLSFFEYLAILPLALKSCHLFLPASSSRFAFTLRGAFGGRAGPSLTLLGSLRTWLARVGFMLAAAEMTFPGVGVVVEAVVVLLLLDDGSSGFGLVEDVG